MVFPAESQPRDTYLLWHIFSYPTKNGHEDAIAVSRSWGDSINAIYSVLIEMLLMQFFQFLIVVLVYLGNRSSSTFVHRVDQFVYEAEPTLVIIRMLKSITGISRSAILSQGFRGYEQAMLLLIAWSAISLVPKFVPAFAIHGLLIGNAAPVNPAQIYVPPLYNNSDLGLQIPLDAISRPKAFRAVGQVETASDDLLNKVTVSQPVVLQDLGNGEQIQKIDYNYTITARDFGLQTFHGLTLNVQGSCRTEYGWFDDYYDSDDLETDFYYIFGDDSLSFYASPLYGYTPIAYPQIPGLPYAMNNTYAIMISSMQCESFTIGTDPWYLTNTTGVSAVYADGDLVYNVLRDRPGLSCWQMDEWTYNNQSSTTWGLPNISGLGFPESLRDVFYSQLASPSVFNTVNSLGSIALASSTTAQYFTIDAASSSIYNDLKRLVLTSYIMTTNLLLDTTLYNRDNTYNASSLVSQADLKQVAQFVVDDPNIATISLSFAVAMPIATLIMFLIVKLSKVYIKPTNFDENNVAVEIVQENNTTKVERESP